jgi:hypothetical protein
MSQASPKQKPRPLGRGFDSLAVVGGQYFATTGEALK